MAIKKATYEKDIKSEIKGFTTLLADLDEEEMILPNKLIEELAFMRVTLRELKIKVMEDGVVTEMEQGAYSIDRENPALKSYNTTIQRYNTTLKQLDDMVHKISPEKATEVNLLSEFLARK